MDDDMRETMEMAAIRKLGHSTPVAPTRDQVAQMRYELDIFCKGWKACVEYMEKEQSDE